MDDAERDVSVASVERPDVHNARIQQEPRTKDGRFTGTLAEGTFTADDFVGPPAGQSLRDLGNAHREQGAYVNVHTEDHPGGELRGQIEPADEG